MPDGVGVPGQRYGLTEAEWNAYMRWFSNTYGFWVSISTEGEAHEPYIAEWRAAKQPYLGLAPGEPWILPEEAETQANIALQEKWGQTITETGGIPVDQLSESDIARLKGQGWTEKSETSPFGVVTRTMVPPEVSPEEEPEEETDLQRMEREAALLTQQEAAQRWARGSASDILAQQQLGLQREQFEWQKQQATLEKERSYEDTRRRLEAEWAGPADWIKRWKLMQQPKTYQESIAPPTPPTDFRAQLDKTIADVEDMIISGTGSEEEKAKLTNDIVALRRSMAIYGDVYQPPSKTTGEPPAPDWLARFVPSQKAGQPITKARTVTPSGQQWAVTSESEKAGLRGYTEYAGYRSYADILGQMAMMLPKDPTRGTQWKPTKARV